MFFAIIAAVLKVMIYTVAWLLLCDAGAEIFFPDSQTRRNHLLSMVDQVMEEKKAASLGLTFESLCRFFSNKDASGLLGLPDTVTEVCEQYFNH